MLELKVHSLANQDGKMEIKWETPKKLEFINTTWNPQRRTETCIISYCLWPWWRGYLQKSRPFIMELNAQGWSRIQRHWKRIQRQGSSCQPGGCLTMMTRISRYVTHCVSYRIATASLLSSTYPTGSFWWPTQSTNVQKRESEKYSLPWASRHITKLTLILSN